jgi:8-amino-7-oxononanoate synthase
MAMTRDSKIRENIRERLTVKANHGLLRSLVVRGHLIDFSSNDYLGLARGLPDLLGSEADSHRQERRGATGSRLISGHSAFYEQVEEQICSFHRSQSALIFSSGYLANISLIGALVTRHTTILYDELIHASLRDGIRLSGVKAFSFRHNDCTDLEVLAKRFAGPILIVVESLYSMDGDYAPLLEIVLLAERYGAEVVVDEAHSVGIIESEGRGLVNLLGIESRVLARTVTFGKALGCHGAAVISDEIVRQVLINEARGFIFTTAMSPHSLREIQRSYQALPHLNRQRKKLIENIDLFSRLVRGEESPITDSPIKVVLIPGNSQVLHAAEQLQKSGFSVVPIRAPSVPAGKERLRICLHSFNQEQDIRALAKALKSLTLVVEEETVCSH